MRTIRMFGRTVTQHETPMVVRVSFGAGEVFEARVKGYTVEQAESRGIAKFRKAHPDATVNSVRADLF